MGDAASLWGLARSVAVYYGRPWKPAALRRLYGEFLGPGDLSFDIGAHVGNRTRALLATGGRVVALEPQALFHRFLQRTLRHPQFTLLRSAAGARDGMVTLAVSRSHPTVSTIAAPWREAIGKGKGFERVIWDRAEEVPCITLDGLIAEYGLPRFVKIDAEGSEAEILAGLSQPVPVIAFEYLPEALASAETCLRRLDALGAYRCNVIKGERTCYEWPQWLTPAAAWEKLQSTAADGRHGDIYAMFETQESGKPRGNNAMPQHEKTGAAS